MPLVIKIAVWFVFNNAWWSIEEFVIDRKGLWRYMPGYKVADACVWDLSVAIVVAAAICWASRTTAKATVE